MCEFFKTFQEDKFTESVKKVLFNYNSSYGWCISSVLLKGYVIVEFSTMNS